MEECLMISFNVVAYFAQHWQASGPAFLVLQYVIANFEALLIG